MAYNIKVKNGIAFNLDDPYQLKQYEHICKVPNVSAYVKRLISMDMMGSWKGAPQVKKEEVKVEVDDDMMLGLL